MYIHICIKKNDSFSTCSRCTSRSRVMYVNICIKKIIPSLYGAAASRDQVPSIYINVLKKPFLLHLELLHLEIESHFYAYMCEENCFSSIWSRCISRSMLSSATRAVHCREMVLNVWIYTCMYV